MAGGPYPAGSRHRLGLILAAHYGGGPGYWLDPDLDDRIIATATDLLTHDNDDEED